MEATVISCQHEKGGTSDRKINWRKWVTDEGKISKAKVSMMSI